jgi:hypothetical protein
VVTAGVEFEAALCLMPEPNRLPDLPLSGAAPRALASGNAYSFATGLRGSTWTGELTEADAAAGSASVQAAQMSVTSGRTRTLCRIGRLW